ncbi:exopolysaccharide biosynthesis protein [Thalassococcus sp. S3]|uniref:exopolysaccharide biosynthesis protein n=1 Tax=Thalassococcus sp. S3 TaxID=2017482 RepID=UPI001024193A|nr:exopolysaccharide biosynthesis protein [Thalassococcus sp. S3]QBF29748.1 exopolysaccharide synthesis protein [Thalassococcus sp. S3]
MSTDIAPRSLNDILDALDQAAAGERVTVADILGEVGERSFTPIILTISVILISPISGIPGMPTLSALLILLIGAQALIGRRHIWLPDTIRRRSVNAKRLRGAVDWLRKPCAWLDRNAHRRFRLLTQQPMRSVNFAVCVAIPMTWPLLEILPMVTSVGAATVALISFGLLTRDGLFVVLGYACAGAVALLVSGLI